MHILLVTYEFPPEMATGGIGSYMQHLAYVLSDKGHRVSVISATTSNVHSVADRGYCINYLIPASNQSVFREMALASFEHYFQPGEVDLIESPEVGACALPIKEKYPFIPLLVKMHTPGVLITKISNTYVPVLDKLRYVVGAFLRGRADLGYWSQTDRNKETDPEYRICRQADLILSPSYALKKWAVNYWNLPEEKINVLANPFKADDDLFQLPIGRTTNRICFVGKLTVLKGMTTFTPAIRQILTKHPSYEMVLIGRDEPVSPTIPSMKAWMSEQLVSVADRVYFMGALSGPEVKQELSKAEIVVVPSLWENYPTVVLEGMAAGCAVAASNRGGISEIIEDGKTGLLFEPTKVRSIVDTIDQLIKDLPRRVRIATAGRAQLQQNNNNLFISATETFYLSLTKHRH